MSNKPVQQPGRPSKVSLQRAQRGLNDRQMLFAAWEATPEKYRRPPLQKDLANDLGVHEITLWRWRKDPKVQHAIRWLVLQNAGDPARLSRVIDFMVESVENTALSHRERMEAAREYVKAVGVHFTFKHEPELFKSKEIDEISLDELSEEEVWELYAERAGEYGGTVDASDLAQFDSRAALPEGTDNETSD